jgi:AcrR family transcriptional regulator
MKTTKFTAKQQEIIQEAFRVWGENCFFNTSLNSLAEAIGISKTALYRYFDGKDSILEAMKEYLLQVHQNLCVEVQEKAEGKDFGERFELYQKIVLGFYIENYWYYRFIFIYFIPHSEESFETLKKLRQLQKDLFPINQLGSEFRWQPAVVQTVQNYIFSAAIFLLFHSGVSTFSFKPIRAADVEALNAKIIKEGFAGRASLDQLDFQHIEDHCMVDRGELLEPDRFFAAIAEVVGEVGLWEAPLDKIARKAGMSKSSLYFHFKNRNDMLWEMIERERQRVGQLYLQKTEGYETFEERLYAYFVVFSSYMEQRKDVLAVMNWFRFQGYKIEVPNDAVGKFSEYIEFLHEGISTGKLRKDSQGPLMLVQWINHFLIQEIFHTADALRPSASVRRELLRVSYRLFLYGVPGRRSIEGAPPRE